MEMYLKEIDILQANINVQIVDKIPSVKTKDLSLDLNSYLSEELSRRELDVLQELSQAKTNKEIAETLFLSVSTIKTHLMNIYEKLDVKNRTQAIKLVTDIER